MEIIISNNANKPIYEQIRERNGLGMENILELQQVSKAFPKSGFWLKDVTFSLPYGAVMGFVGENGAGKTTTIGCILNTIKKDGGTVKLFGREMLDRDTDMREKIGVVYDGDNFPSHWNAKQLSQVMAGLYQGWDHGLFQKYLTEFYDNVIKNQALEDDLRKDISLMFHEGEVWEKSMALTVLAMVKKYFT